jgi:hypothetical protein
MYPIGFSYEPFLEALLQRQADGMVPWLRDSMGLNVRKEACIHAQLCFEEDYRHVYMQC